MDAYQHNYNSNSNFFDKGNQSDGVEKTNSDYSPSQTETPPVNTQPAADEAEHFHTKLLNFIEQHDRLKKDYDELKQWEKEVTDENSRLKAENEKYREQIGKFNTLLTENRL